MIITTLRVNHNMERYPDKPQDQRYCLAIMRSTTAARLYFYFTKEELLEFTDQLVNMVSNVEQLENNPQLAGFNASIDINPTNTNPS